MAARHVRSSMRFCSIRRTIFFLQILADEHSTCSTSNNDIRHHLIISTATSSTSPSGSRGTNGSDFGTLSTASPTTMSTVYQSVINPYLTAISDESPNVVRCFFFIFETDASISALDIESLCFYRYVHQSHDTLGENRAEYPTDSRSMWQ